MGKCDIEKFHDTQDHLCIVLGFDKDGKLLFGELVSDFEAKMLNAMQRRSLLNVKNKRVDLIETFNYDELNEGERNTLYILTERIKMLVPLFIMLCFQKEIEQCLCKI